MANLYDVIILATSKVSVTGAALRAMGRLGVDLVVLEWNGRPSGRLSSPVPNKSASTRLRQYEVILKGEGLNYVKPIIIRKITEQGRTLRYFAKTKRFKWLREASYELEKLALDASSAKSPEALRAVEAQAAKLYWGLLSETFPDFPGREHEGCDPYNSSINYSYGILYSYAFKALSVTGLDPYAGLFHTIKSGREALVYDFSEQFKPLVDRRTLLSAPKLEVHNCSLTYASRKALGEEVKEFLERCDKALLAEAWSLASSMREGKEYVPGWKGCT